MLKHAETTESPHCLRVLVWSGQIGPAGAHGELASPGDEAEGLASVFAHVRVDRCSIESSFCVPDGSLKLLPF